MSSVLRAVLSRYAACKRGSTAILFAMILPVLMLAIVGGLDTAIVYHQHSKLQDATDSAALSAARGLQYGDNETSRMKAVALNTVKAHLSDKVQGLHVDLKVNREAETVEVRVDHRIMPPIISGVFGTKTDRIYARATARISEDTRRIVLSN